MSPPAESPTILKRTSLFYDHLPQDNTLSSQRTTKNQLTINEKPKNKSDSHLNKNSSNSSEDLNIEKKLHVWKSSPSLMRKFKMSIRGSPLMSRKKVVNNNDEKDCSSSCVRESGHVKSNLCSRVISKPIYTSSEKISNGGPSVSEGWTRHENLAGSREVYFIHNKTGQRVNNLQFYSLIYVALKCPTMAFMFTNYAHDRPYVMDMRLKP